MVSANSVHRVSRPVEPAAVIRAVAPAFEAVAVRSNADKDRPAATEIEAVADGRVVAVETREAAAGSSDPARPIKKRIAKTPTMTRANRTAAPTPLLDTSGPANGS
jgi:hypothetical protein